MPVQGDGAAKPARGVDSLPWDDLADAYERMADAERHGSADDIAAARDNLDLARERVAALGNLLLLFAFERMGLPAQKQFSAAFDGLARAAWDRAARAAKRAAWAINELNALRQRVRALEEARQAPTT